MEKVREQQKGKAGVYYNALEALGHAYAYAYARQRVAAERIIAELKACPEDKDDTTYRQALICAGLGELDKVLVCSKPTSIARHCRLSVSRWIQGLTTFAQIPGTKP